MNDYHKIAELLRSLANAAENGIELLDLARDLEQLQVSIRTDERIAIAAIRRDGGHLWMP